MSHRNNDPNTSMENRDVLIYSKEEKFETSRVLTITSVHAVHDTYTAFLPPLLPALIEKFTLSKMEAGFLTFFLQTPSLLQPVIGYFADRRNLRILVVLAPAVSATMMSLLGVAPSFSILTILLILTGLSSAAFHAIGPVITGRYAGRSLGRGMGFWMVGGELGRTLGPIIIVSTATWLTLRGTLWLMFFGWLSTAALSFWLRSGVEPQDVESQELPWRSALREMKPIIMPLVGILVARASVSASLTTYLPTLLTEEGASLWMAGASLTILEAAGVVGALFGGSVSDWLGRRLVLLLSFFLTPMFMFFFVGVKDWEAIFLLVMLGLTGLSVTPVIMAIVQESYPQNRSLANGIYMALSFSIRSVVVVVLGALGDYIGLSVAFRISAALMLIVIPLLFLLPKEK